MMKGTSKASIHGEENKKKRNRGKLLITGKLLEEGSSMLVEEKKKSSNLKRKNKVKNLVEKQRPNDQVDLKEHSGHNSSEAQLIEDSKEPKEIDTGLAIQACKSKKTKKKRKKEAHSVKEALNLLANGGVTDQDESYTILSSYGERKDREARAAEGGWTVVVHHKGRKKTTDSESGIVVGSVAQAAVERKTSKKHREVWLNFYRFKKKEAQRNEIMMLQSKFEEDKKRLQQLRASRKFRPY